MYLHLCLYLYLLYLYLYVLHTKIDATGDDRRAFSTRLWPRQLRVIASVEAVWYIRSGADQILFIYTIRYIGYISMYTHTSYICFRIWRYIRAFWRQFCAIFACRSSSVASSVSENSKVNEKSTNKTKKANEKSRNRKINRKWKLGKHKSQKAAFSSPSKINKSHFAPATEKSNKNENLRKKKNIQKRNLFKTSKTLVLFALSVKCST